MTAPDLYTAAGFSIFPLTTEHGTAFWLFHDDAAVADFATHREAEDWE